jgi:hypothetical protein
LNPQYLENLLLKNEGDNAAVGTLLSGAARYARSTAKVYIGATHVHFHNISTVNHDAISITDSTVYFPLQLSKGSSFSQATLTHPQIWRFWN